MRFLPSILSLLPILIGAAGCPLGASQLAPDISAKADVIIVCRVMTVKPAAGGQTISTGLRGDYGEPVIKGTPQFGQWDVFVPAQSAARANPGDIDILFTVVDSANQRLVLLPDASAVQAATAATVDALRKAVAQAGAVDVKFSSDKQTYQAGDPITLTWTLTNPTEAPITIYAGDSAFDWSLMPASRSTNVYLPNGEFFDDYNPATQIHSGYRPYKPVVRSADDYKVLAPGSKFEKVKTLTFLIPAGGLHLRMRYINQDNQYGAGVTTGIEPGVVYADNGSDFQIQVGPPSPAGQLVIFQGLASNDWEEQWRCLNVAVSSPAGPQPPQVRALAGHPWPEIRKIVAKALADTDAGASPELVSLLYDPEVSVRQAVERELNSHQVNGIALPAFAVYDVSKQAAATGLLPLSDRMLFEYMDFYHQQDLRLGDIMAARVGDDTVACALAYALGIQGDVHPLPEGQTLTDAQRIEVKTAWEKQRPAVSGVWTEADLKSAENAFRKTAGLDTAPPANVADIYGHLKAISGPGDHPADVTALNAMDPSIAPTVVCLCRNDWELRPSWPVFSLLVAWKAKSAEGYLLARSYDDPEAATALMSLDPAMATPIFAANRGKSHAMSMGLIAGGDKRGVPGFIHWTDMSTFDGFRAVEDSALSKVTGQNLTGSGWMSWWQSSGSKLDWN